MIILLNNILILFLLFLLMVPSMVHALYSQWKDDSNQIVSIVHSSMYYYTSTILFRYKLRQEPEVS